MGGPRSSLGAVVVGLVVDVVGPVVAEVVAGLVVEEAGSTAPPGPTAAEAAAPGGISSGLVKSVSPRFIALQPRPWSAHEPPFFTAGQLFLSHPTTSAVP